MALQRVDEAGHRGQRRAQFVAGIGDEIGAHLLGCASSPVRSCSSSVVTDGSLADARRIGLVVPLDRHAEGEFDRCWARRSAVSRIASSTDGVRRSEEMCFFSRTDADDARASRLLANSTRPDASSSMSGSGRCSNISRASGGRRREAGPRIASARCACRQAGARLAISVTMTETASSGHEARNHSALGPCQPERAAPPTSKPSAAGQSEAAQSIPECVRPMPMRP